MESAFAWLGQLFETVYKFIPHILIIDPRGIVRWEGFPFLPGFELTDKVVADIINKYSN